MYVRDVTRGTRVSRPERGKNVKRKNVSRGLCFSFLLLWTSARRELRAHLGPPRSPPTEQGC